MHHLVPYIHIYTPTHLYIYDWIHLAHKDNLLACLKVRKGRGPKKPFNPVEMI